MPDNPQTREDVRELEQIAQDMEHATAQGMSWISHDEAADFVRRIRKADARHSALSTVNVDALREARIILLSEDHGAQTHGLFSTFEDALLHAKKDGAHSSAEWQFTSPDRAVFLDDRTFWTASREPVRAALSMRGPEA